MNDLGIAAYYCTEICGDGIIINKKCDDKNFVSGDGCSSDCEIEAGYECEYAETSGRSFCYKAEEELLLRIRSVVEKVLDEDKINVTLVGDGILLGSLDFDVVCEDEGSDLKYEVSKT